MRNGGDLRKLIVISAILIAATTCVAQSKKVETSLAGVNLGAPMTEVRRILGSPTRVVDTPIKDVAWPAGEREYMFVRDKIVIKVVEDYYQKPGMHTEHSSGVLGISAQGSGPVDKPLRTGLGLSLGDSVQTVRKLYGRAPQVKQHIQIHWTNGNILDIDLDSHERVSEIELSLDQE
jgi:hypothetical protein